MFYKFIVGGVAYVLPGQYEGLSNSSRDMAIATLAAGVFFNIVPRNMLLIYGFVKSFGINALK